MQGRGNLNYVSTNATDNKRGLQYKRSQTIHFFIKGHICITLLTILQLQNLQYLSLELKVIFNKCIWILHNESINQSLSVGIENSFQNIKTRAIIVSVDK